MLMAAAQLPRQHQRLQLHQRRLVGLGQRPGLVQVHGFARLRSVQCFANLALRMRLLVEIVVIGALISLGWNTPFKEWSNRATTEIQKLLHSRRQTPSGVTTIPAPTAPREREETLGKGAVRKLSPGR